MLAETVYIGGYADFSGIDTPLTLVMSNSQVKGGIAAAFICFSVGLIIDFLSVGQDSIRDRIAGAIYYGSTVSAVAFFGWSKPIQDAVIGMNVTGQAIDGALFACLLSGVAHLYLIVVILEGLKFFDKLRPQANKWMGIAGRGQNRINTKILTSFPLVALTVPLAAGPMGFFVGLVARASTFFTMHVSSWALFLLGAN